MQNIQNTILIFLGFVRFVVNGNIINLFEEWIRNFKIKVLSEKEKSIIFNKWLDNHKYIEFINSQNLSYTLGHNAFSGMDLDDYIKYMGFYNLKRSKGNRKTLVNDMNKYELSNEVDWVKYGAVTSVKDQGQCGSCWSFSSTGAIESAYVLKTGNLVNLSEQQLVDCDRIRYGGKDHGCNGGLMENAFTWVMNNDGMCTDVDYPYVSGETQTEGSCKTTCSNVEGTLLVGYMIVLSCDEEMMRALSMQPISIGIEADQREFQLYKSGVFKGECGTNLDHGVLLVGYGKDEKYGEYYKVKNSWGTSWGESGYIRLGRGPEYNNGDGQCGLLLEGSYPIIA